nr:hypothetical protein [uncultured Actinoplanes sp.]
MTEVFLPNLTLLGAGAFFVTRTYYNIFFGSLGIDPESLGSDYGTTLASSMGLLAFITVGGILYPVAVLLIVVLVAHLWRNRSSAAGDLARSTADRLRSWLPRALRVTMPVTVVLTLAGFAGLFWMKAEDYGESVRSGRPIKFGSLILTTFGVRASPLDLTLAPGEDGTGETDRLTHQASRVDGKLFYLGEAKGRLVLYDAVTQRAVYLPADKFVVQVLNCETTTTDQRCKNAVD